MNKFVRSVPAMLLISAAFLSLIALAGCGASGSGGSNAGGGNNPSGPGGGNNPSSPAAKNIYALQYSQINETPQDSVLVFSASATGATASTSTLDLPSGFDAICLAIGPQGQIYIDGLPNSETNYGQILEYAAGSTGSAIPTVTLNGSATSGTTFTIPLSLAVDSAGTLFVSSQDGTLEAFASGFTASSPTSQYVTWGTHVGNFSSWGGPLGVDNAGDIFYLDEGINSGIGIHVFAAGATGDAPPIRTITGTDTNSFDELKNIAVDGAGDVYVTNYNPADDPFYPESGMQFPGGYEPTEIIGFAAGASGNATPTDRIGGAATNIVEPLGLAVDGSSNLYYGDFNGGYYNRENPTLPLLMDVFSSSSTGNVAPSASTTLTGVSDHNISGLGIAVR